MANAIPVMHPDKTDSNGLFPSAVVIDGWVYVSGQGPLDVKTGKVVLGAIAEQTLLTLKNIDRILTAAGATRRDIVKCTCYLTDRRHYQAFNEAWRQFFTDQVMPARTTVYVDLNWDIDVEIDAVARLA